MKHVLKLTLIGMLFSIIGCQSRNKNFKEFIGKDINSFLSDSRYSNFKDYVFTDEPPGLLSYLTLEYADGMEIELVPKSYKYVKQFNIERNWDLNKLKQETIVEIRVKKADAIVELIK